MKYISDFQTFINEAQAEELEFQDWLDDTDHHDPILRKYAIILSKQLPKFTGDFYTLETKTIQITPKDLFSKGLFAASDWDRPQNPNNPGLKIELAWDQSFGMVIVLDGDRYIGYDNKSADFHKKNKSVDSSDIVFNVWKKL